MALSNQLQALISDEYEEFIDRYQPTRDVEEFTDITHTAIQTLLNWSHETGTSFEDCVANFLQHFVASVNHLKTSDGCETLEHWRIASRQPEVFDSEIENRKAELVAMYGHSTLTAEEVVEDPILNTLLYLRKAAEPTAV